LPVHGVGTARIHLETGEYISMWVTGGVPGAVTSLLSVSQMVEEGLEVAFAQGTCVVTRPDRSCVARVDGADGQYILRGLELESLDSQLTSRGTRRADSTEPDRSNEDRA